MILDIPRYFKTSSQIYFSYNLILDYKLPYIYTIESLFLVYVYDYNISKVHLMNG